MLLQLISVCKGCIVIENELTPSWAGWCNFSYSYSVLHIENIFRKLQYFVAFKYII